MSRLSYTQAHGACPTGPTTLQSQTRSSQRDGPTQTTKTSRKPASPFPSAIGHASVEGRRPIKSTIFLEDPNHFVPADSFAFLQMSLVLSKMLYTYDFELLNKDLEWEAQSKHYIMWWKAPIRVRATERSTG